jgi:hypothetical protein
MNEVQVSYMKEDLRLAILVESVQVHEPESAARGGRSGTGAE